MRCMQVMAVKLKIINAGPKLIACICFFALENVNTRFSVLVGNIVVLCCCFTSTVQAMAMRGRLCPCGDGQFNLSTLFLGRLRPPKRYRYYLTNFLLKPAEGEMKISNFGPLALELDALPTVIHVREGCLVDVKLTCTIALQSTYHCRVNGCYLHGCRVYCTLSTRLSGRRVLIYPAVG